MDIKELEEENKKLKIQCRKLFLQLDNIHVYVAGSRKVHECVVPLEEDQYSRELLKETEALFSNLPVEDWVED